MKTTQEKIDRGMAIIEVCKRLVMAGITLTSAAAGGSVIASFVVDHLKTKQSKNK